MTPVFLLMLFGIFEIGLMFRDSLTTNNAAQQGARAASVAGRDPDADYLILRSVEHGLTAMGLQTLDYVVVFQADGPNASVPASCLAGSQAGDHTDPAVPTCNRYEAADFFLEIDDPVTSVDTGNFRCSVSSVDRFWCPTDRETTMSVGTEYVGIHIQTRHAFITGFFGLGSDLTETRIVRLEPDLN